MNVLMFTNTYFPVVGGVSESVQRFVTRFREAGHNVLTVAPAVAGQPMREEGVIRVPAVQRFNGSDFSLPVPVPGRLHKAIRAFRPDLVHAHHPFLLGDAAVRAAQTYGLPLVFTHHTLYERYTHYVPGDSPILQNFAVALATGYANLCDAVIAPSESVRDRLLERGVRAPVRVVPSGVDTERLACGDGTVLRRRVGLPRSAWVVGHVGRLAPEKNLTFLTRAVCRYLQRNRRAHFLIVGDGPGRDTMVAIARRAGLLGRLRFTGVLHGDALADAYGAMDAFAFASHSETQGLVVAEAMAAGLPVVAVDAPGVREVVADGVNGVLLARDDDTAFAEALAAVANPERARRLQAAARRTAARFDTAVCAARCLAVYREARATADGRISRWGATGWALTRGRLEAEWRLLRHRGRVLQHTFPGRHASPGRWKPTGS